MVGSCSLWLAVSASPAGARGWLVVLVLGGAVVLWLALQRLRRRRLVQEMFDRSQSLTAADVPEAAPERRDPEDYSALEIWLARAGYEGSYAGLQFALRCAAAFLLAAFFGLLVNESGFAERAVTWLEEIPGGIADLFVPVMQGMSWLVVGMVALVPVAWVRRERRRRTEEVERDLPTVLSLLATLVESGLGFDAAALRVERSLGPNRVLSVELARVRASTLAGASRAGAIRGMAHRLDVPGLTTFSSALVHAESQGASIGETLRQQATDLWSRRREEAIQRAQTLPTKLAFPLVLCFLPGVFVWTFGPAVSEFVRLAGSVVSSRP